MSGTASSHPKRSPEQPMGAESGPATSGFELRPDDTRMERLLKLALKLGFGTVVSGLILWWLATSYLPSNEARADRLIDATRADLKEARAENQALSDRYLQAREEDRAATMKLAEGLNTLATEIRLSRQADEMAARTAWRNGERNVEPRTP